MARIKLEHFDFEGIEPQLYRGFSCSESLSDSQNVEGVLHYRRYMNGNVELVETLPNGVGVERAVYTGEFPDEEPYREEIWLNKGEFVCFREYCSEKTVDYDEGGLVVSTHRES